MDPETVKFIQTHLDSRTKLDLALFLHRNPFTLDTAGGLARRIGASEDEVTTALKEMVQTRLVTLHGDPADPNSCLFGFTEEGYCAKQMRFVAEAVAGAERATVLDLVLEAQSRRHHHHLSELRRLESLKAQFLSMISHELRSPLTAIRGYISLLKANPDIDPAQREKFLSTVLAQCDRLSTTVNNLILAAEMQQEEGWRGECLPLSLPDLVGHLVEEIAATEPQRRFQVSWPESLPPVLADPIGAEVVIHNLLDNAVKFSPENSTIRVWAEANDAEVHLHIRDEGVGIHPDHLHTLFQSFRQADYCRTRRVGGMGLGLYLAKEILEGMGGRIAVRSEFGKGSVFTSVFRAAPIAREEVAHE